MVSHFGWLYTPGWAELIALILGGVVLLAFVLRQLVKWSAVDERKRIELVLQAYTFKILHHYMDNKELPGIRELQQMQREAIEHTPETWEYIPQPRMR